MSHKMHSGEMTPDDYLSHVSVEQWDDTCDGGPTTWQIEVGRDE